MAIPKGWTLETLSSVVIPDGLQTGPFGSQLKASEYATDGVPVIMPKDMKNGRVSTASIARIPEAVAESRLSPHRTQSGDLLFARRGEIGRCALITSQELGWVCGTGCLRARPGRKVHPAFLLHQILDAKATSWLTDMAVGQTMLNLNTQILSELPIALPPLPEQKKIAAVLSSVDAAIEKTEAVIAQLQVVKKAMMEQLLTKGLPGRHTRFKQTDLGEIPEEWEVAALGDVSETRSGGTPDRQRPDYWCGSIPWIKTAEVNYSLIESAEESITEEGLKNSAAHVFPIGTILMAMYGQGTTRGRVAILGIPAATNQACLGITPGARLCTQYLFQWLKDQYDSIRKIGNEGAQKNLNAGLIRSLRIPIPHIDEQKFIAKSLDSIDARCSSEQLIMRQLTAVKSSLSSSLLSGELRVPTDSVPCPV